MSRNIKKSLVYFLILVLPLILIFSQPKIFTSLKFQLIDKCSFFVRLIALPFKEIKKILYYHRTFEEYIKLRREVSTLRSRLIGMEEVLRENTRLEQLLNFKRKLIYSSIAATVIGRDPSNWNASMIIDKGSQHGIGQGMPVVNASGIIGKIAEVGVRSSKVILVNDPNFSIPGLLQRPREVGLVTGNLNGLCRMDYLSPKATIEVGDKVISSKLSSSFPEGLLIGEVLGVEVNPNNATLECVIQPAVNLSQVEEVLVIQK